MMNATWWAAIISTVVAVSTAAFVIGVQREKLNILQETMKFLGDWRDKHVENSKRDSDLLHEVSASLRNLSERWKEDHLKSEEVWKWYCKHSNGSLK